MTWRPSDVSRRSSWTKAEIRRARQTPLKPVLEDLGYQLTPLRNGNYLVRHLVAEIVVKDHYWVSKDHGSAGNAIDFLVDVQNMSFSQAMDTLLSSPECPAVS